MCFISFIENLLPTDLPTHGVLPDAAGRRQPARGRMHAIMRWPCVYVRQQAIGGGGGRRPWGLWGRTFGLDTRFSGFGAFGCVFLSFFCSARFSIYLSIYLPRERARHTATRARSPAGITVQSREKAGRGLCPVLVATTPGRFRGRVKRALRGRRHRELTSQHAWRASTLTTTTGRLVEAVATVRQGRRR